MWHVPSLPTFTPQLANVFHLFAKSKIVQIHLSCSVLFLKSFDRFLIELATGVWETFA